MKTKLFYLHALSALHVGVGQAVGTVDLPIARCRATNLPLVPGSALKGVLRDEFAGTSDLELLFGPENITDAESSHASALAFGDALLLVFPVRSFAGIVAFVTCPFVLNRYAADLKRVGEKNIPAVPDPRPGSVVATENTLLKVSDNQIILEDMEYTIGSGAAAWAEHLSKVIHPQDHNAAKHFQKRFVVLRDDDFAFLTDTATEVRARIRIDDNRGVVQQGALWYEENLPAETVLWGMMAAGPSRKGATSKAEKLDTDAVWKRFEAGIANDALIQIGGKATVGRGLVRFLRP